MKLWMHTIGRIEILRVTLVIESDSESVREKVTYASKKGHIALFSVRCEVG